MRDNSCQPTSVACMKTCQALGIRQIYTNDNNPPGHGGHRMDEAYAQRRRPLGAGVDQPLYAHQVTGSRNRRRQRA
jgi:hypothetical protein